MSIFLPEKYKIVSGTAGIVTTNGGVTCDYVSLRNIDMAWIVLHFLQAATHATVINPRRATAVDGTGSVAINHAAEWWKNADISATDTLVRQTAATTASCTLGVANQLVVIQIDPAQLGNTYDVMGCVITDSTKATNFVSVVYYLETRYGAATPPAAITD